jgi:UPF0331 protein MA_1296
MSKTDKDLFRLEHIRDSIDKIIQLSKSLNTLENFEKQWVEQDAMIRNFEIIGEASNHVSQEIKDKYPEVAWNEMRGMRNFMTHEYFGIQLDTVWVTVIHDIPTLKTQIINIIEDLSRE